MKSNTKDINKNTKYWKEWINKFNICKVNIPSSYTQSFITQDGVKIGRWVRDQRTKYRKGTLHVEKIELLESLPRWKWKIDNDDKWDNHFDSLVKYVDKFNEIPTRECIFDNFKIGNFVARNRQMYEKEFILYERKKLLESLPGWQWKVLEENFTENYEKLKKLGRLPNTKETKLHDWVRHRKQEYKNNELSDERIEMLEELEFWEWYTDFEEIWLDYYKLLEEYVKNNHKIPIRYVEYSGKLLGDWVSEQRKRYKKGKLITNRILLLEKIPYWKWELEQHFHHEKYMKF